MILKHFKSLSLQHFWKERSMKKKLYLLWFLKHMSEMWKTYVYLLWPITYFLLETQMLRFLSEHTAICLRLSFYYILMSPNTTPSKMPSLLFIRGHLTYYDSPIECHYYRQATVLHSGQILWDRATFISQIFLKFCSTSLFGFVMVDTDYQIIIFLN